MKLEKPIELKDHSNTRANNTIHRIINNIDQCFIILSGTEFYKHESGKGHGQTTIKNNLIMWKEIEKIGNAIIAKQIYIWTQTKMHDTKALNHRKL